MFSSMIIRKSIAEKVPFEQKLKVLRGQICEDMGKDSTANMPELELCLACGD